MYTPAYFAEQDLAALDALIVAHPFVTLMTLAEAEPVFSHLPVLCQRSENRVLLRGHWARANPQSRHAGPATIIVHGPQAYVSPAWYPDKESAARVPTWNYAVAHLRGTLELFDDDASLAQLVSDLSDHFERSVGSDWRFENERPELHRQLRGIVGFRFHANDIQLKFKLSQNHPAANIRSVIAALEAGNEQQAAVAELMRQRLPTE